MVKCTYVCTYRHSNSILLTNKCGCSLASLYISLCLLLLQSIFNERLVVVSSFVAFIQTFATVKCLLLKIFRASVCSNEKAHIKIAVYFHFTKCLAMRYGSKHRSHFSGCEMLLETNVHTHIHTHNKLTELIEKICETHRE